MKEFHDSSGRLTIEIGEAGPMFDVFAARLELVFRAKCVQKLEGLSQRYWEFEVDGTTVELSLDNYLGIMLSTQDGSRDDLLRQLAANITGQSTKPSESESLDSASSFL